MYLGQGLNWLDQRDGGNDSGEFVAGEERFFHRRVTSDAGIFGMRHHGASDDLGPAPLLQDLVALVRMVVEARVLLVVEVVNQADDAPQVFVDGVRALSG